VSVESPFRQHTQVDLEQDHKRNDDVPSRVLAIEASRLLFVEILLKHARAIAASELLGPGDEGAIARVFFMA
jgi:hypothetical protein